MRIIIISSLIICVVLLGGCGQSEKENSGKVNEVFQTHNQTAVAEY